MSEVSSAIPAPEIRARGIEADPRLEVLDLLRQPPGAVAAFNAGVEQQAGPLVIETHGRPFERQALESQLALHRWVVAGEPGEPLPPGVHEMSERPSRTYAPQTSVEVSRHMDIKLDRYPVTVMAVELMGPIYAQLKRGGDVVQYEAALANGMRQAIQDSPGYAYFTALERPVIQPPDMSPPRALINALHVSLLGAICTEFSVTPDSMHLHYQARDAFDRGKQEIEDMAMHMSVSLAPKKSPQGVERIRHHLTSELVDHYRRLNPTLPFPSIRPIDIQTTPHGRLVAQGDSIELDEALRSLVIAITDSTLHSTPEAEYVRERIQEAFRAPDQWALDASLDKVSAEIAHTMAHPSRSWGAGRFIEKLCWLRRTPLTPAERLEQPKDQADDSSFVSKQELELAANTYNGEILHDNRLPGDAVRMIMAGLPDPNLPLRAPEEPLLTIGLTANALYTSLNGGVPFIPGMRMVAARTGPAGGEFDFVADTSQPDPYAATTQQYTREQWDQLVALADNFVHEDAARALLLHTDTRTASDLALAFRSGTKYGLPDTPDKVERLTMNVHSRQLIGSPELQCKHAAKLFVQRFSKYLPHARPIIGPLQLPTVSGAIINGVGHAQVSMQENGRWHILEVTPRGEPTQIAATRDVRYPVYGMSRPSADPQTIAEVTLPTVDELLELFSGMDYDELTTFVSNLRGLLSNPKVLGDELSVRLSEQLQANRKAWKDAFFGFDLTADSQPPAEAPFNSLDGQANVIVADIATLPRRFLHDTRAQFGYLGHRRYGNDAGTWNRIVIGHSSRLDPVGIAARHIKAIQPSYGEKRSPFEMSASELARAGDAADLDRMRILELIGRTTARRRLSVQPRYPTETMRVYAGYLDRLAAAYDQLSQIRGRQEVAVRAQMLGGLTGVLSPQPAAVAGVAEPATEKAIAPLTDASGTWTLPI